MTLEGDEAAWVSRNMEGRPELTRTAEEAAHAKFQIPGDGHPTAYANRLRAAILKNYIEQHLSDVLAVKPEPAGEAHHAMRQ